MHSPSGLAALEECPRKYAWRYVDKIPGESNKYAQFGIKVHSYIEAYYRKGQFPPIGELEGNCAVALLSLLPPPQPGMKIEEHRTVGRYHGYIDLTFGPTIFDHKTTSSLQWAKTPAVLLTDLQACIYAHFLHAEGHECVTLQWNYVTREKKPRTLPVVFEVTPRDIAPTLDRARTLADQADFILRNHIPALALPPNPRACDAYGGCQHRHRCNLTPSQRMEGLMNMTSAADFMKDMNAKHPAPPAAAPPPPAGNPWDHLPADHQTATSWYNYFAPGGPNWVLKTPAAPIAPPVVVTPPPPPAAVAPPAPPVPINPPPVPPAPESPMAAPPEVTVRITAPEPAAYTELGVRTSPVPHAGSPSIAIPSVTNEMTPALARAQADALGAPDAPELTPYEAIACALEDLALGVRALGGATPAKRRPGRPRKT